LLGSQIRHSKTREEELAIGRKISASQLANSDLIERRRQIMSRVGLLPKSPEHVLRAGSIGAHRRWHTARGILNPQCSYC
jgi:hypothetical protein